MAIVHSVDASTSSWLSVGFDRLDGSSVWIHSRESASSSLPPSPIEPVAPVEPSVSTSMSALLAQSCTALEGHRLAPKVLGSVRAVDIGRLTRRCADGRCGDGRRRQHVALHRAGGGFLGLFVSQQTTKSLAVLGQSRQMLRS